jgi:hypothetical protein
MTVSTAVIMVIATKIAIAAVHGGRPPAATGT